MGLFQKKPSVETTTPPYKIDFAPSDKNQFGMETTLLIVGLGNTGKEYAGTRHNIGFDVIDNFAKKNDFPDWNKKPDLKCLLTHYKIGKNKVILVKPTTYMNSSGESVQALQHFYKLDNTNTLVIYDEIDIDFGLIRTRIGGKAAGHNGVQSIIQHCGEEFGRIRIGIGPKKPAQLDSADFVLAKFNKTQLAQLANLMIETNSILSEYIHADGSLISETRSFIV